MPGSKRQVAAGVDVGGTFTDIVVGGSEGLVVLKLPTTANPSEAVLQGLRRMSPSARDVSLISHATTLATNALLTHSGLARTALITNEGFRDILEIGRQRRPELYDLKTRRPPPLVERHDRLTVACRITADGRELVPLDDRKARSHAKKIRRGGFDSVAVCFLNSYLNNKHEKEMRTILVGSGFRGHVVLSSEVDREYREFERTSTTVVNAVLAPLMSGYLSSLRSSLTRSEFGAPVYVMNSDGGASTISFASMHPASVLESGPAAGVIASQRLARQLSMDRVLTFDMGGTTAKAGTVIDGRPDITNEFEAAGKSHSGRSIRGSGYPVRGQFIDLAEVSAGGGTIAWVDETGELKVGPLSAGSTPGPACYARGGTEPTVTDANVLLGRLNPVGLLGGSMPLHRDLAARSIRKISGRVGLGSLETATGIVRLVNDSMARAISMVTLERGRDPRDFVMCAFGGAGPVHACDLAEEMGIRDIVVPPHAGLFSAYGLLSGELTRTFTMPVMQADPRLEERFQKLEESAGNELDSEGFKRLTYERFFEGRYLGQSHELLLPFDSDSSMKASFDSRHRALYGYTLSDRLEVVNIKVRGAVRRKDVGALRSRGTLPPARPTTRAVRVGKESRRIKVFRRESLAPGDAGVGPCIIEEYDSTLVVNPSWKWSSKEYGTRLTR